MVPYVTLNVKRLALHAVLISLESKQDVTVHGMTALLDGADSVRQRNGLFERAPTKGCR